MLSKSIKYKHLGVKPYEDTYHKMQLFTQQRSIDTTDEIWLLEHLPVFTLGRNTKPEHILSHTTIPEIQIDRGGQVTYHGPGQLMMYVLLDLKRADLGVRQLVSLLEACVIDYLATHNVSANSLKDAPGVYVEGKKIAALGLRVSRGYCYHGLCFNIDMDLQPYQQINPCGYENLEVMDCASLGIEENVQEVGRRLAESFVEKANSL